MTGLLSRRNNSSQCLTNILARAGPGGEPVAALSICLCIVLYKVNLNEFVTAVGIWKEVFINGRQSNVTVVRSISTDLNGFFQWNIFKEVRDTGGTEKNDF